MNIFKNIKENIKNLPESAGIYEFIDKNGKIIYIGKAKNIRKRVSSYFVKSLPSFKTKLLVDKINKINYVVVDNESDALLLENNLIKKLQPYYNVLLKDDKSFPWICVKNENFPRVFYTRQKQKDGSKYFGPFTSVYMVKTLLNLIKKLYPLRTCNHKLDDLNIKSGKYSVCLEYHIGNCSGPCEGKISDIEYSEFVEGVEKIVKGDIYIIQRYLNNMMLELSKNYEFEKAEKIKEKLNIIENYKSKSTIVSDNITNLDVFAITHDLNSAYVNYLKVSNGAIIQTHTIELKKKIDENEEDLLLIAITEIRESLNSENKNVIVPFKPDYNIEGIKWLVPKKGDKKKLLELSERNAKFFMLEKHKRIEKNNPEKHIYRKLETLKNDLRLKSIPAYIECFDVSGIQGTNTTAACIVFRNAKPSKNEYRHFNIKSVKGQDDYASIREVILRRYSKLIQLNQSLPDLIIVDGGKGQLNAAIESLKSLDIFKKVSIIGIAKKLEEIYFPNDSLPLYLNKNSESLKIIQQARNEAHRFGLKQHRKLRSDKFLDSELNNINGIGIKTTKILLSKYKSINNIKKSDINELEKLVGRKKAEILSRYFLNKQKKY